MAKASHNADLPPSGAVPGVVEEAPPVVARGAAPPTGRRPNPFVLAVVTALAAAIGLLPWLEITGRGLVMALLVGEWLVVAFLRARVLLTATAEHPRAWELALGVVSSLFPASLLSAVGLLVYGAGLGAGELVELAGAGADTARGGAAEAWAFGASTAVAALLCPPCAMLATDNTSQQLYPRTAGLRAAYSTLLAQRRRRRAIGLYGLPALLAGGATLLDTGPILVIVTQVFVLLWSATVFSLGRSARSSEDRRTATLLRDAFSAEGYAVVEAPRTGDSAVDPLLVCVDLLAYSPEHAFAVQLKTESGTVSRIPWADAAAIELAASTLADVAWQLDVVTGHVEPVLVLTGEEPSEPLRLFCEREDVHLVVFPDPGEPGEEELAAAVAGLAHDHPVAGGAP